MSDFETINPVTEEVIREYSYLTKNKIQDLIEKSDNCWKAWRNTSFEERAKYLSNLGKLLEDQKESLGKLITTEMGKPIGQSISEVEKCAWVCYYYAENAAEFLENESISSDASSSYVSFQPLGPVLAIMPWNFPFWQVFRFAAPALMAGNVALLKHSPNTTGCALEIQDLFETAGFPKNAFLTLIADVDDVEFIIANPRVKAVTLTGSTRAGKSVASLAGKYLKKTVLELGGSDPYVILDDANLDKAAEACVTGRLINSGQSCIAAKRFIVTEKNQQEFNRLVHEKLQGKTNGNPLDDPDIGFMARKDLRDQLHEQVIKSIQQGAKCILGGKVPTGKGYFYPVTLLTNVKKGMPAFDEELFGPVAVIITAKDENEALDLANDTDYGLGAALFTQDHDRALKLAEERLEAGCVFINDFVKSDPRLPFGGIKNSGYGRELSIFGIREFVNTKTVYLK